MTLRTFATATGQDPANVSRIERQQLTPTQDLKSLNTIADVLEFQNPSVERLQLIDLAAVAARRIPADIAENEELLAQLPVLFRKLRSELRTDDEQLHMFKKILKGG
jgi:hypothetical protein